MSKGTIKLAEKFMYFFNPILLVIFIIGRIFAPNFLFGKPNFYILDIVLLIIVEIMEAGMVYFLKPIEKSKGTKNKN